MDGEQVVYLPDQRTLESQPPDSEGTRAFLELTDLRTTLFVALRKDGSLLGFISAHRHGVRPFLEKEIALLKTFADQAVIAMENARLLTETREALEQQTATAEVLQIINSSPGDLAPVFDVILENAMRLCEAAFGIMNTYDGGRFRTVRLRGAPAPLAEFLLNSSAPQPEPDSPPGRIISGEDVVQVEDLLNYKGARGPRGQAMVELGGARSYVTVALRKDGRLMGTIAAYRQEVRPFSDKQIALLQNFAAQAVIAMENARLLTETREALEQQTATAEVLQVINSSPGELTPVFDAMLEKALHLCEAAFGLLSTYDGEQFHSVVQHGVPEEFVQRYLREPFRTAPNTTHDRLIRGEHLVHVTDLAAEGIDNPRRRAVVEVMGRGRSLASRCAKTALSSVPCISTARRFTRFRTNRSLFYKTSPRRRSLRWRMRGS